MPGGEFMPAGGQGTGSAGRDSMTGRTAWGYGWPSSYYGSTIVPPVLYIPVTAVYLMGCREGIFL